MKRKEFFKKAGVALAVLAVPLALLFAVLAMADTWGDQINDSTRFIVLGSYGGAAVQDQETGLVWEQSPNITNTFNWHNANFHCNQLFLGGRMGWRVPTVQELGSIQNLLPGQHPFTFTPDFYWSVTIDGSNSDPTIGAWGESVVEGAAFVPIATFKSVQHKVWCVRGGQGGPAQ